MCNFIGRKRELEAMDTLYNRPGFQMTVMYGRRRVGKSTLLQRFAATNTADLTEEQHEKIISMLRKAGKI